MFGLGAGELFLIFIIALLFLGPKKLPELARGLGQAVREFQKTRDEMMNEVKKDVEVTATKVHTSEPEITSAETTPESPKHS